GGGGGRGGGGGGNPATVTLADNSKLEGTLVRKDDFLVILMLDDGTRKSIPRSGVQKIEVNDPKDAHKSMAMKLIFDDPDNKKLNNTPAYGEAQKEEGKEKKKRMIFITLLPGPRVLFAKRGARRRPAHRGEAAGPGRTMKRGPPGPPPKPGALNPADILKPL